jgi:hypothetical protein
VGVGAGDLGDLVHRRPSYITWTARTSGRSQGRHRSGGRETLHRLERLGRSSARSCERWRCQQKGELVEVVWLERRAVSLMKSYKGR